MIINLWVHFILLYPGWIYIVAISFIGGIYRSTRRKPHTWRKSMTNFIAVIKIVVDVTNVNKRPSWSWPYGNWIYNYLSNQCISLLKLWVRIPLMARLIRYETMWQRCLDYNIVTIYKSEMSWLIFPFFVSRFLVKYRFSFQEIWYKHFKSLLIFFYLLG